MPNQEFGNTNSQNITREMSPQIWWMIVLLITAVGLILYFRKENFKVMGSLGPYGNLYRECMSACEKSDPNKQLGQTHGNMMCAQYCDSILTDIARRGGPSYPTESHVGGVEPVTVSDRAYAACGDGSWGEACRKEFITSEETLTKCAQDCQYSPEPGCVDECRKVRYASSSTGWSWK